MEETIHITLHAALKGHQAGTHNEDIHSLTLNSQYASYLEALTAVFDAEMDFMSKLSQMDNWFEDHEALENVHEFFFDLLMINFFSSDVERLEDDYLESDEWLQIEDDTIDRGTEMLNILLYLREAKEEDIEPDLDDYLNEFLLVDDEEFQDEHEIYEDVIAGQSLMETDYARIAEAAKKLPDDSQMKEVFNPLMAFFFNTAPDEQEINDFVRSAVEKPLENSIYLSILAYNESLPFNE